MVRFDKEDVRRIAALARLDLADSELERFALQLRSVLEHVAVLEQAGGDERGAPADEARPELREDVVAPAALALPLSEMAPAFADGFFTVPRLHPFDPGSPAPPA